MKTKDIPALLIALAIPQLAGGIGSVFTASKIPGWYASLVRSPLNPPGWVFGPVWTTLFVLMGIAAFLVYQKGWHKKNVQRALEVFGLQLILNTLWSILFFGLQNPFAALIEIFILWLAILWTIVAFYKVSRTAAYLLIPYIVWVSFASFLNGSIVWLN